VALRRLTIDDQVLTRKYLLRFFFFSFFLLFFDFFLLFFDSFNNSLLSSRVLIAELMGTLS
jgi:hypothetical protein